MTCPETVALVLTREPEWASLPAETPPLIRRLLRRCLEKDRKQRLDSAADARLEIEEAMSAPSAVDGAAAQPAPATRSAWSRALTWTWAASTLGLVIALGLALWAPWRAEQPADRPLVRLDVDLGADVSMPAPPTSGSSIAISPDGTRLAYASGNPTRLFVRRLDQAAATELPGTQGASRAVVLARRAMGRVHRRHQALQDLRGRRRRGDDRGRLRPSRLGRALGRGGQPPRERILRGRGLFRIPAGGGPPEILLELGSEEMALPLPRLLPGGKAVMFAADTAMNVDTMTIEVLTLADRKRKIVARGGHSPRYRVGVGRVWLLGLHQQGCAVCDPIRSGAGSRRAGQPSACWTMSHTTR